MKPHGGSGLQPVATVIKTLVQCISLRGVGDSHEERLNVEVSLSVLDKIWKCSNPHGGVTRSFVNPSSLNPLNPQYSSRKDSEIHMLLFRKALLVEDSVEATNSTNCS